MVCRGTSFSSWGESGRFNRTRTEVRPRSDRQPVCERMRRVLMLQNLAGFPSRSSVRYATSLALAIKGVGGFELGSPEVRPPAFGRRVAGEANASRWGRLVRYPRTIRRLRLEKEHDVTHVIDHSHANLLGACEPRRSVVTLHDVIPMLSALGELDFDRGRLVKLTFGRKLRRIERCARIIVPSEATKRQALRFLDIKPQRVVVVPHGVELGPDSFTHEGPDGERERVLARYGIDPRKKVVLHVCTRNRYKNSPAVLRMLAKLPKDVALFRVGGPLFDDEADLARELGVTDRVVDAGRVPSDDGLAACYRASDVFVFPSTFEGFGWPPLEAMACGTPVVTSNAASLPEVAGDAGVQVDPKDDAALADAVRRVLDDPEERTLRREAGLERAKTFTWEACARKTLDVYEAVAREADKAGVGF
ncbi:MAG: glycosyltransferase family 1 protein [Planctomycetota bacterium]